MMCIYIRSVFNGTLQKWRTRSSVRLPVPSKKPGPPHVGLPAVAGHAHGLAEILGQGAQHPG